jgi:hypothetical protein
MLFHKTKLVAQLVGFACIGLLALYGLVAALGAGPSLASRLASSTSAPAYISYQGTLRDADDNPAEGTYDMVVKIYDNASATGAALWSETKDDVEVREGHFNLLLGESNAIDPPLFKSPDRYVQLTVDGTEMVPTQRFASVPYAMVASFVTSLSAPDGSPMDAVSVDDDGNLEVDGNVQVDGKVGINIPPSSSRLTVSGPDSDGSTAGVQILSGEQTMLLDGNEIDSSGPLYLNHNSGYGVEIGKAGVPSSVTVHGNLGVGGAPDPSYDLDVAGSAQLGGNLDVDGNLDVGGDLSWSGHLGSLGFSYWIVFSDGAGWQEKPMQSFYNHFCFLTGVFMSENDTSDEEGVCEIEARGSAPYTTWYLKAHSAGDGYTKCHATCVRY